MTDRTLRTADDLDALDFDKGDGLIPMVAQDAADGRVLMVAWADAEALERTLETGLAHFRSRTRDELWKKGETSGNTLALESLHADCDGDTVLARVRPAGPACHTGEETCFGEGARPRAPAQEDAHAGHPGDAPDAPSLDGTLSRLDATLASRQAERPEGSYTIRLLDDDNLRLKKLGEETTELVVALAGRSGSQVAQEAADLLYHLLVALRGADVALSAVAGALEERAD